MTNLNLPAWLSWLGSPEVCTVITAVAVVMTGISWFLKDQNRKLRLEIQTQIQTAQGGQQQQGQQQQAIQQITGNVTINNNYYNTEGEN